MVQVTSLSKEYYQPLAHFLADFNDGQEDVSTWLLCFKMWWDNNPCCLAK